MPVTITNGTVSRTIKPADYEARTVTLSFSVDAGDDIDAGIAHVMVLAEKYARQTPNAPKAVAPEANPVQEVQSVDPPTEPVRSVAPAPVADTRPIPATTGNAEAAPEAGEPIVTDDALQALCVAATARARDPFVTKAVIRQFTDADGMSFRTVVPEKRAALAAALEAVGRPAANGAAAY